MHTIGAVYRDLLCSYDSAETHIGKCLKDDRVVMLEAILGDLLEDLLSDKEGKRGVKIGSWSWRQSSSALGKVCIKLTRQYQALRGAGVLMKGMRNLNICVG